jgi:hypothetical protein
MTLIAGFMKNGCPILMGDLLISNVPDTNDELVIPTLAKISSNDFKKSIYKPSGLSQKVNLLSPKLALAWSGSLLDAKMFMGQVMGAGLPNNPSRESILDIYNDLSPRDLSVIGLLRNGRNITIFDINASRVDTRDPSFTWFKAGGTGFDRLTDTMSKSQSTITNGTMNKLNLGISTAIEITTNLLALELETTLPLQELFGTGYEILHPLGNGLAKFEDLTYYFWLAEEVEPQKWRLSLPFLAMKNSYHGDVLIIRSVRLSSGQHANKSKIDSDELHVIKPIYRIVDNKELVGYNPASLNSKYLCNAFLWKKLDGQMGAFSTIGRYDDKTLPIIWSNEFKPSQGIDINSKFLHETITKIASSFGSTLPG